MILWIIYFTCVILTWVGFYFYAKEYGKFTTGDVLTCFVSSLIPAFNIIPSVITLGYLVHTVKFFKFLGKEWHVKPFN